MLKGTPYPSVALPTGVRMHYHWAGGDDLDRASADTLRAFAIRSRTRLLLVERDGSPLAEFDCVPPPAATWAEYVRDLFDDLAMLVSGSERRERPLELCYGERGIRVGSGNSGLRIDGRTHGGYGELHVMPPGLAPDPGASPLERRWPALFDRSLAARRPEAIAARQSALDSALASALEDATGAIPTPEQVGLDLRRANLDSLELANKQPEGMPWVVPDLRGALMSGCDLRRANLRRADLRGADLSGTDMMPAPIDEALTHGAALRPDDAARVARRTLAKPTEETLGAAA